MKEQIAFFLLALTSIFTVVNPFGAMTMIASLTAGLTQNDHKEIAKKAVLVGFTTMLSFAFAGEFIFNFFSISVNGLKIVGGVLFFISGYDMLQGKESRTKSSDAQDTDGHYGTAISPLGIPTICGPGSITASTVLVKQAEGVIDVLAVILAICLVGASTYLFLRNSRRLLRILGPSGNKVFMRLMGLIIMMIAVEYFFSGLAYYLQKIGIVA